MSAPNTLEHKSESEDINTCSEEAMASAELVFNETSLGEVDELNLNKNGQELAPLGFHDIEFLENKQCKDVLHCREIIYTAINMCFKVSRHIESYYRYDDILAANNDTTRA